MLVLGLSNQLIIIYIGTPIYIPKIKCIDSFFDSIFYDQLGDA